jgi:predicted RNA-binding protein
MCESTVFLEEDGELSEVMQEVAKIEQIKNKVVCLGLLGDRKEIENATIIEANLMEHRIVLGKVN